MSLCQELLLAADWHFQLFVVRPIVCREQEATCKFFIYIAADCICTFVLNQLGTVITSTSDNQFNILLYCHCTDNDAEKTSYYCSKTGSNNIFIMSGVRNTCALNSILDSQV